MPTKREVECSVNFVSITTECIVTSQYDKPPPSSVRLGSRQTNERTNRQTNRTTSPCFALRRGGGLNKGRWRGTVAYSGVMCDRPRLAWPWISGYLLHCICKLRFAIEPWNPCPKVSSDCPCFLSVKNCVKINPNLSFLWQKWFLVRGPAPSTTPKKPRCLRPSPRYLLTEILDRLKFYYLVDLIDTYGIKEAQLFLTNSTISSFLPIGFTYISQFYLPILQWIHGVRLFYDAM